MEAGRPRMEGPGRSTTPPRKSTRGVRKKKKKTPLRTESEADFVAAMGTPGPTGPSSTTSPSPSPGTGTRSTPAHGHTLSSEEARVVAEMAARWAPTHVLTDESRPMRGFILAGTLVLN